MHFKIILNQKKWRKWEASQSISIHSTFWCGSLLILFSHSCFLVFCPTCIWSGLFLIPDVCYLFLFGRNEVCYILYDLWQKGILCILGSFLKSFSYPSSLVLSSSFCFPLKPQNKVSWCLKWLSELIEYIILGPLYFRSFPPYVATCLFIYKLLSFGISEMFASWCPTFWFFMHNVDNKKRHSSTLSPVSICGLKVIANDLVFNTVHQCFLTSVASGLIPGSWSCCITWCKNTPEVCVVP